jgi:hypothetical protein
MDVQSLPTAAPANTECTSRDDIGGTPIFLPAALLEAADVHTEARAATRLLITLWLVTRGEESTPEQVRWVVMFWHERKRQLNPTRRFATMTTVLFELEWLGFVESFEPVPSGFAVKLKEVVH